MYGIKKVKGGFAVVNPNSSHVFSNHALTKKQANKQRVALAISSSKREHKPISSFFI
jgi:hypothetical protein